jgi:hypothetical protein
MCCFRRMAALICELEKLIVSRRLPPANPMTRGVLAEVALAWDARQ